MSAVRHYTFAGAAFEDVVAHDGRGRVAASRVLQQAAGVSFVDLVDIPPGVSIGDHTHGGDEEVYVIVSGRATMRVDGRVIAVGPGDVVVNRPGGRHGLDNPGPEPLRMVVVDVAVTAAR